MTKNTDLQEQFNDELQNFALKYSLTRLKLESPHYDRDYKRDDDGVLRLKSEKAVIRALGKTTKVPIGEGHPHQTYEEAEAFARNHWSEYFRKRRARRTEAERRGEARRQKRYRERRKALEAELKRQQ